MDAWFMPVDRRVEAHGATGAVLWQREFEAPVLAAVPYPPVQGCLVLLDWSGVGSPTFENLFLLGAAGEVRWRARLPQSHDAYVEVRLREGKIHAWTFGGFRVTLRPDDGTCLDVEAVK